MKHIFKEILKLLLIIVSMIALMIVITYTQRKEIKSEEGMTSVEVTVKEVVPPIAIDYTGIPFMTKS